MEGKCAKVGIGQNEKREIVGDVGKIVHGKKENWQIQIPKNGKNWEGNWEIEPEDPGGGSWSGEIRERWWVQAQKCVQPVEKVRKFAKGKGIFWSDCGTVQRRI